MKTTFPLIKCRVKDLGLMDYLRAWDIQKRTVAEVIAGSPDTLLFCEHPTVLTLGRLATEKKILWPQPEIEKKGIPIIKIDRGGEVTLHAPGQIVIYPILNLEHFGKDLKQYLEKLQQVAIDLLRDFDIVASSLPGQRGVWVGERKIASLGIGVKKWVAYHGMSININTDLRLFSMIRPCGLEVQMTSIQELTGQTVSLPTIKEKLISLFSAHFHLEIF